MTTKRRATLHSGWWLAYFKSIRHCYGCGESLIRRYIKAEKRRRLICVSCQTITYVNPKVVVGVIPVLPDQRVVLLRRNIEPALGKWTFPAGFMELGESIENAAVRETWEEICARVKLGKTLGIYSYPDAAVVTVVYQADVLSGQTPMAGEEAQKVSFFKPRQIPWSELAFRSTIDALKDWLRA